MRKYLESFEDGFDETIAEKIQVENWPYVGYDETIEELVFTIIPKPKVQQNNEVWYTTSDGEVHPFNDQYCDATLISNTYENGIGIAVFDKEVTRIWSTYVCYDDMSGGVDGFIVTTGTDPEGEGYISSLISLSLPNTLQEIGEFALCYNPGGSFNPQSSLKEITFGKSIKVIKGNLFDLDTVYYKGTINDYNSIEFLDNYYNADRIDALYLKEHSRVSGNANPANGAELIFV